MRTKGKGASTALAILLAAAVVTGASGCGYLSNVGDDFLDCFSLAVGVTPPVVPGGEKDTAVGIFPPSLGVYAEASEFLHLGAVVKHSADVEWDRRGLGLLADRRLKLGIGPFHYIRLYQEPIAVNDYKERKNGLDAWREHMAGLKDPVFDSPGKRLVFDDNKKELPFMHRGWQNWLSFNAEVAVPEPFITHSGFNARVGFNLCEVFDFAVGLLGLDLYTDNAYYLDGTLRYGKEAKPADDKKGPSSIDKFFGDP